MAIASIKQLAAAERSLPGIGGRRSTSAARLNVLDGILVGGAAASDGHYSSKGGDQEGFCSTSQIRELELSKIPFANLFVALTDSVRAFVFLKSQVEWNYYSRDGDDHSNKNDERD